MSRDIRGKLSAGETLDEVDVQYAVDALGMGAELKGLGYDVPENGTSTDPGNFGTPTGAVVSTGPAFESATQDAAPGVFLDADALSMLKADTLDEIASAVGVDDLPRKKADKVAALSGGAAVADDEDDEDEDS
jgi:hypothetical protein